jgi:predicted transcriptional regulator
VGVVWSREQQQVRAEIGRHLKEHYEVGSGTIPTRFAQLVEKIERSQSRSQQLRNAGHPMSKRDEYLANAKECERLAESTPNAEERAAWLQMAQQWLRWANGKSFDASRADEEPDRG